MRKGKVRQTLALLLAAIGLLASCSSINSFFKGSADKLKKAETAWNEGKYADAVYDAISIIKEDPEFEAAKVFIRDRYADAILKTRDQIEKAEGMAPLEREETRFQLYSSLKSLYSGISSLGPISGAKNAWTWQPDGAIPDGGPELEKARESVVNVCLSESANFFKEMKATEGRDLLKKILSYYIKEYASDSDAKKALRAKTIPIIISIVKDYGRIAVNATTQAQLEEAFKTFDFIDEYAKGDAEIASLRATLEAKAAEVYVSEGKALEASGDIDSLLKARAKYQQGLKKLSKNTALTAALGAVNVKIADAYYEQGYAKEQLGDDESLKAAIALYQKGFDYDAKNAKLIEGAFRAQTAGAERYYQQGLTAEKAMGRDPAKGKAVIALYKKAQEWIEDYKDTSSRIETVTAATTVTVLVSASGNTPLERGIEKSLASALKNSAGTGFKILPGADNGISLTGDLTANGAEILSVARRLNALYHISYTVSLEKPVVTSEKREAAPVTVYYYQTLSGEIGKLKSKADYDAAKVLETASGGYEKFIAIQKWKEYGIFSYTDVFEKRVQTLPLTIIVSANTVSGNKQLWSRTVKTGIPVSEEILSDVKVENNKFRDFALNGRNMKYKALLTDAAWQKRVDDSTGPAKEIATKAKDIVAAIKADAAK